MLDSDVFDKCPAAAAAAAAAMALLLLDVDSMAALLLAELDRFKKLPLLLLAERASCESCSRERPVLSMRSFADVHWSLLIPTPATLRALAPMLFSALFLATFERVVTLAPVRNCAIISAPASDAL